MHRKNTQIGQVLFCPSFIFSHSKIYNSRSILYLYSIHNLHLNYLVETGFDLFDTLGAKFHFNDGNHCFSEKLLKTLSEYYEIKKMLPDNI